MLKPLLIISKRLKLPYYDRVDANFIGPLRIHFKRTKSTLDSLMYLGRWVPRVLHCIALKWVNKTLSDGILLS